MVKIPSDGRYRSVPNSHEPGVAKKEETTYESALREEGIDEANNASTSFETSPRSTRLKCLACSA